MTSSTKPFLGTLLAALLIPAAAIAQPYPSRPITLVETFGAGGPTDVVARLAAQQLAARLGKPVVVQNIAGAGGSVGAAKVAQSAPDGYTVLFGTLGTQAFNLGIYKRLPYDPVKDFEPVALLVRYPLVLVVNPDAPYRTLGEFLSYAKARPGQLSYGSGGTGSTAHVGCHLFNTTAGIEATHVPYRSTAPATIDLIGGNIQYLCDLITTAVPNIQAGKTRALAISTRTRSPALPDVPTLDEAGLRGFEAYTWNALFVPKGTPKEVIARLREAAVAGLREPEVQPTLRQLGIQLPEASQTSSAYLGELVTQEIRKWVPIIRQSGAAID